MTGSVLTMSSAGFQWWLDQVHAIRTSSDVQVMKHTIFGGILNSKLPDKEKTDIRLASEAQLVVFAGEGTTGPYSSVQRHWYHEKA